MPKTFFTYEQQLNKLQNEKQLTITNPAYAEEVLEKLSYYSLIGGYKKLFKHPASGNYIYGVTFEEIVAFYYFDEELRTLFLKYILHVERHMKSMISYNFCEKYGENQSAYLDENNYNLSKKNTHEVKRLVNSLSKSILNITVRQGSSANIRKSNIPCTLTLRLINLYYSGHTWYALPSSTCCLSPQQIRLIMDWQRNFRQHQDLFPGLPQNERVPLGLIFYNGQ